MANNIAQAELRGTIDYTRQRDWFDPTKSDASVTMVGCGGIGSPTALALAKVGIPKLTLIDGDIVDTHNLPNQFFPLGSQGSPKVDVLAEEVQRFSVCDVRPMFGFLDRGGIAVSEDMAQEHEDVPGYKPSGIVVSGLDSMSARKDVWQAIRYNINVPLYVDARIGGEVIVLHAVDPRKPDQCRRYEESLFDDSDAVPAPCTRRSVIDVGFSVASLVTRMVRRYLADGTFEHTTQYNHADLRADYGKDA